MCRSVGVLGKVAGRSWCVREDNQQIMVCWGRQPTNHSVLGKEIKVKLVKLEFDLPYFYLFIYVI